MVPLRARNNARYFMDSAADLLCNVKVEEFASGELAALAPSEAAEAAHAADASSVEEVTASLSIGWEVRPDTSPYRPGSCWLCASTVFQTSSMLLPDTAHQTSSQQSSL